MWRTKSGFGAMRVTIWEYLSALGSGARALVSIGPATDPFCDDIRVSSCREPKPIDVLEKVLADDLRSPTLVLYKQLVRRIHHVSANLSVRVQGGDYEN